MRQALHIFGKDVRRFAPHIGVLAALTTIWAWANIAGRSAASPLNHYAGFAAAALVIGWWYLISLLIHEEALSGDRQFWITRPYSHGSLLASKLLFVLVFFSLPLLLGGFAILAGAGYQPLAHLPNFLWMQLTLTATVLSVAAGVAALTRNLMQFVLSILGLFAGFMLLGVLVGSVVRTHQSSGLAWSAGVFSMLSVAVPGLVVLVLQLRLRNRWISAATGVTLMFLMLSADETLSRWLGTAVETRMFGQTATAAATRVMSAGDVEKDARQPEPGGVAVAVPLRVTNIPAGVTAAPELVDLTLETPGGRRWSSGWTAAASMDTPIFQMDPSSDGTFTWKQAIVVDRAFWGGARSSRISVRGELYVMLFSPRVIPIAGDGTTRVPGDRRCTVTARAPLMGGLIECESAFHAPYNYNETVQVANARLVASPNIHLLSIWNSPLPADFGMNPLFTVVPYPAGEAKEILFHRFEPKAYIHRSFSGPDKQLSH